MDSWPVKREPEPEEAPAEIVDPEIVGIAPPPEVWWRRLMRRAAFSAVLGVFGMALCVAGALLTITIVGAAVGIPILVGGLGLVAAAVLVFLGGGRITRIR